MTRYRVWASLGIRPESVGNPLGIRPESVGNPLGIRPESGSFNRLMIRFMIRIMSQLKTRRMVAVVEWRD